MYAYVYITRYLVIINVVINLGFGMESLFVLGNPRSGTSLLRLLLTSHSSIIIPPECGFILWLYPKYSKWNIDCSKDFDTIKKFCDDLFSCKKIETWGLERSRLIQEIARIKPKNYNLLCECIYILYGDVVGKKSIIWGDKNNYYLHFLDDLLTIFPDAKFLHIVRDGRDVACSYRNAMSLCSGSPYAPNLPLGIQEISLEWKDSVDKINIFFNKLRDNKCHTIKYEDLVMDSVKTLQNVCQWLGVPYESCMLNFYIENKQKKLEPELTLDWKQKTLLPIKTDSVGQYEKQMHDMDQVLFLKNAKDVLEKYNYI